MDKKTKNKQVPIYIDICSDFGFKRIFQNPEHKHILLRFLNRIMEYIGEKTIIDIEYQNTEHVGFDDNSKSIRQDLECKTIDGRNIIIEVQREIESDFRDRMCFYTYRKSIENVQAGKAYKLQPVYTLVIAEEEVRKNDDGILQMATLRFENSDERFLQHPILLILELSKIPSLQEASKLRYWHEAFSKMGDWSQAPDDSELIIELEDLLNAAEFAKLTSMEQLEYYKQKERERGLKYVFEHKINQGIEIGMAKGIDIGTIKVIETMLKNGFDWDTITKGTNITQEEFNRLKA